MNGSEGTSMESLTQYSSLGIFPRISQTIEHIVDSHPEIILSAFNSLKKVSQEEYEGVINKGLLEIGCGRSFPRKAFFERHPLKYYLGIDLMKGIDYEETFGESLLKVRGRIDAFPFLEGLPDNSIPYCFMSFLDSYILGDESGKLSELLDRKVSGKIFIIDSAIFGKKVIRL